MRRVPALLAIAALTALGGCGPNRSKAEIEEGKHVVVLCLEAWKCKEQATLQTLAKPIDFREDQQNLYELTDYAIGTVDAAEPPYLRYSVKLKLKDKRGQAVERDVVYSVELTQPIRVRRDPYF